VESRHREDESESEDHAVSLPVSRGERTRVGLR
jgi:hypothetical protein